MLTLHFNQYQFNEIPIRSTDVNGIELLKVKAKNGTDSITERKVVYKEFEKRSELQSSITYRLVEISSGKIILQKTIQGNKEQQIRYARNNNANYKSIYPTRMFANQISRDDANYNNLQNLFQNSDQIDKQVLINNLLSDFRNQIVTEVLRFNPEK